MLRPGLGLEDLELRRAALVRWARALAAYEAAVVVVAGLYALAVTRSHPTGWAWIAPALGLVVGSAVPLQLVAGRILRSALR